MKVITVAPLCVRLGASRIAERNHVFITQIFVYITS